MSEKSSILQCKVEQSLAELRSLQSSLKEEVSGGNLAFIGGLVQDLRGEGKAISFLSVDAMHKLARECGLYITKINTTFSLIKERFSPKSDAQTTREVREVVLAEDSKTLDGLVKLQEGLKKYVSSLKIEEKLHEQISSITTFYPPLLDLIKKVNILLLVTSKESEKEDSASLAVINRCLQKYIQEAARIATAQCRVVVPSAKPASRVEMVVHNARPLEGFQQRQREREREELACKKAEERLAIEVAKQKKALQEQQQSRLVAAEKKERAAIRLEYYRRKQLEVAEEKARLRAQYTGTIAKLGTAFTEKQEAIDRLKRDRLQHIRDIRLLQDRQWLVKPKQKAPIPIGMPSAHTQDLKLIQKLEQLIKEKEQGITGLVQEQDSLRAEYTQVLQQFEAREQVYNKALAEVQEQLDKALLEKRELEQALSAEQQEHQVEVEALKSRLAEREAEVARLRDRIRYDSEFYEKELAALIATVDELEIKLSTQIGETEAQRQEKIELIKKLKQREETIIDFLIQLQEKEKIIAEKQEQEQQAIDLRILQLRSSTPDSVVSPLPCRLDRQGALSMVCVDRDGDEHVESSATGNGKIVDKQQASSGQKNVYY